MTSSGRASERNARVLIATLCLAAAALVAQLIVRPIVGLANEGDFHRVMSPSGLRYTTDIRDDIYYGYIIRTFAVVPAVPAVDSYLTSEVAFVWIARGVNALVSSAGRFDLRCVGLVHLTALLCALALLVRATRDLTLAAQWSAGALLVVVFTDVGYAAAFNSFYPQTASLLFLLLTLGVAAEAIRLGRLQGARLVGYFLGAALFVCSKPQEAIQAPLLALWGAFLAGARPGRLRRSAAVWLGAALVVVGIWYYRQTPRVSVRYVGLFHTYFRELLRNSPDVDADMRELGIAPDWKGYVGMHAYKPGSPILDPSFQSGFLEVHGFRALLAFYLRHPARLADRLTRAAPAAFGLRPPYLGNFERSTGLPPRTQARRFAVWSDARAKLARGATWWLGLFFGGNLLAIILSLRSAPPRGRLFLSAIAVCLAMAAFEFLTCSLADALDDLGRHLYTFDVLCDLVLVADCAWAVERLRRRPSPAGRRVAGPTPS